MTEETFRDAVKAFIDEQVPKNYIFSFKQRLMWLGQLLDEWPDEPVSGSLKKETSAVRSIIKPKSLKERKKIKAQRKWWQFWKK